MKKLLQISILMIASILFVQQQSYAACTAPTGATTAVTPVTCSNNGKITVTATGGEGVILQYALYNAANTTELKPYQTSNEITSVASGTYTVRVRYACDIGFSDYFSKSVTVTGSYVTPNITTVTVQRHAQCGDGRVSISHTGGVAPYTYAIVPELTSPLTLPLGDYIRAPQSSNIFDSLAVGTYFVRIMDDCGGMDTRSVTINNITTTNPLSTTQLTLRYKPCDSLFLAFTTNLAAASNYVPGTKDTLKKIWINFPDGSTDTLHNIGTAYSFEHNIPFSKLGTVTAGQSFPNNIGGTWPKSFTINYRDVCGNIYNKSFTVNKPNYRLVIDRIATAGTCSTIAYRGRIVDSANIQFSLPFHVTEDVEMNYVTGGSWVNAYSPPPTFSNNTELFYIPTGEPFTLKVAFCGDTLTRSGGAEALYPLIARVGQNNLYACAGNVALNFYAYSGQAPIVAQMVSGPAGASIPSISLNINTSVQQKQEAYNVPAGEYIFKFTDACGQVAYDTIDASIPMTKVSGDYYFPCGSTEMKINLTGFYNYIQKYSNPTAPFYTTESTTTIGAGIFRGEILNAANATVGIIPQNSGNVITIPASTITGLAEGSYTLRITRRITGAPFCDTILIPWNKSASLISLSNTQTFSPCDGTTSGAAIIAQVQGGVAPFSYSLYENVVSAATLVAGPQSSNIFSGLDNTKDYILTVADACGRATQNNVTFGPTEIPVSNNSNGFMPCEGDTFTMSVAAMPGITYQWYKNDVALVGETSPSYTIAAIDSADTGTYTLKLSAGSCLLSLNGFDLDLDLCGEVLMNVNGVELQVNTDNTVSYINWKSITEKSVKYYVVERSKDGKNWSDIYNTGVQSVNNYNYIDNQAYQGMNFYRIRQVDMDNNYTYSITKTALINKSGNAVLLYPNPATHSITVRSNKALKEIKMVDIAGRVLSTIHPNQNESTISVTDLADGIYYLMVTDTNGEASMHKFTVIK